ncbi:MoxR family ATPase [Roseibium sp. MMSF_3412]|uniref:AAA family ATPase n=1 Tax=Roseibium sp. MMSF_3412 TaxID=3046712 RepID=UPI00273F5FC2|nr:MoxR family ATPase [Roseibium sp. MMSF_3412]
MTKETWKIFSRSGGQHDKLDDIPPPPPWRRFGTNRKITPADDLTQSRDMDAEATRAEPFIVSVEMELAVNTALYLRRPLLLTGKPGTGKSTLIAKVAHQLKLGPVLRWPINSRSSVREGIYEYDAVGRLQSAGEHGQPPSVDDYLTLGPLGTALAERERPRALLIDELDKSDLDFANDLLNLIEEGEYVIRELQRIAGSHKVRDFENNDVDVTNGKLCAQFFPFVVMTSNGEREFPSAFQRRCIRLSIAEPTTEDLIRIVESHLDFSSANRGAYATPDERAASKSVQTEISALVDQFVEDRRSQEMSTDQLLNAVFLTVGVPHRTQRSFGTDELEEVKKILYRSISGTVT